MALKLNNGVVKTSYCLSVFLFSFCLLFFPAQPSWAQESVQKKAELERQIGQLEQEANELDNQLQSVQAETRSLASEKKTLDTEIRRREVEIKRLTLVLKKTAAEIAERILGIDALAKKIGRSRRAIAAGLFSLYTYDHYNPLTMILGYGRISEFFSSVESLTRVQATIQATLDDFKENRELLAKEKEELEEYREEQRGLHSLQEVERRFLAQKKKEKEELLRLTKGKEALFQQLLKSKKRDLATLKTQLFYLEKTGVTAEDAIKFAELAARRAGIRPAFLLALLEVETGKQFEDGVISVGTNLGTGHWKRDLYDCYRNIGRRSAAESEKKAFFKITGALNLDPDKMPVSRRPSYGCGGAMGPAQFLPTTWLRFESRVAELTGHNPPNPWSVEDAFTASALFLADSGAKSQTVAGESRAARTYLSGSPSCRRYICNVYASRIAALARDIDRIL